VSLTFWFSLASNQVGELVRPPLSSVDDFLKNLTFQSHFN
jgi:hypothetical protein